MGRALRLRAEGENIILSCSAEDFESVWRDYFDLGRCYRDIRAAVSIDDYMKRASDFGAGIRILRQDKWEALCSFIISQCNNIPRIKKIVETLCRLFGDEIDYLGGKYYSFPSAEKLAALEPADLAPLRSGYRAPYIISAARRVASGELDLEKIASLTPSEALKALKSLNGVGDKVANCAVLFGLTMLDAFPIDVWMKRALAEHYPDGFDPGVFSPYAGIAQQYMFYYARSGGES
ncbi:MAG: DNA-3-methyladenine glycosylase 2 family protein [Oscillospiraceae bacterium]|nr:DNA-3-methyladenine glycosylase 2 family protein [Oscillospiraceae bacterium]